MPRAPPGASPVCWGCLHLLESRSARHRSGQVNVIFIMVPDCVYSKACNVECPDDGLCCFDGCADTCLDSLELPQPRPQLQFPFILTEPGKLTEGGSKKTAREEEGRDIKYWEILTRSDFSSLQMRQTRPC